jgi:hypothetical protein
LLIYSKSHDTVYTGNNFISTYQYIGDKVQIGGMFVDLVQKYIIFSNPTSKTMVSLNLVNKNVKTIQIIGSPLLSPGAMAGLNSSVVYLCDSLYIMRLSRVANMSISGNLTYRASIIAGSAKSKLTNTQSINQFNSFTIYRRE